MSRFLFPDTPHRTNAPEGGSVQQRSIKADVVVEQAATGFPLEPGNRGGKLRFVRGLTMKLTLLSAVIAMAIMSPLQLFAQGASKTPVKKKEPAPASATSDAQAEAIRKYPELGKTARRSTGILSPA